MSATTEDYVKRIYSDSIEQGSDTIPLGRVADLMGVTPGTVTTMMKQMDRQGLVHYKSRGGVSLTGRGVDLALNVLRRHRLIELYLVQKLGYSLEDVHEEAEQLEHAVSPRFIAAIDGILGHPHSDPHGDPIPQADGSVGFRATLALSAAIVGKTYVLARVEDNRELLVFLETHGISLGSRLRLLSEDKGSGLVYVSHKNAKIALSKETAAKLFVGSIDS